jgi:hypothetical protein
MTASPKEFKGLRLHSDQIEGCLLAFGVQSLVMTKENAKVTRFTGTYEDKEIFIRIFDTDKGSTIGFGTGKDRTIFEKIANEIVDKCSYAGKHSLALSVPKVPPETLKQIEEYLEAEGAVRQFKDDDNAIRVVKRWQGPKSDKIALTHYKTTNTLVVQGINAHAASLVLDMLRILLPSTAALAVDLDAFSIPISVDEAKSQASARLPAAHDWVADPVRRMLSSALAMMQTTQNLEDYCGVASPALRGLEGFLKQVYCIPGQIPEEKIMIGDWFEQKLGKWVMCTVPAMHVGPTLAPILAEGYSIYHAERHTLSHMGFDPQNTRLIENIEDARTIVNKVLDFVDSSCAKIRA